MGVISALATVSAVWPGGGAASAHFVSWSTVGGTCLFPFLDSGGGPGVSMWHFSIGAPVVEDCGGGSRLPAQVFTPITSCTCLHVFLYVCRHGGSKDISPQPLLGLFYSHMTCDRIIMSQTQECLS